VEFALILPVFLVLFAAALDLGRLAGAQISLANAAREAAFQAAVTPTSYQAGQPCPTVDPTTHELPPSNLVICRALLEAKNAPVTVRPADVSLSCSPTCSRGLGNTVSVRVSGQFQLLTPVLTAILGHSTLNFGTTVTNQIETLPSASMAAPTPGPTFTPLPTATATPEPTVMACTAPSAGFTYTRSPSSNKSPVTVTVTDTSTSSSSCPIQVWEWNWGDGVKTYGKVQSPHVYYASGSTKTYFITLTVWNSPTTYATSGAVTITVKP
jgi:Flp pilus assembly protein TadG